MSWIKIWKGVCRYPGEHWIHSHRLFCLHHHVPIRERERSSEIMIPVHFYPKKPSITLFAICFQFQDHKDTKILFTNLFCFVNLRAMSAWQPLQLVGDAKLLFYCCRLLEESRKRTTVSSPRVQYKPSNHPYRENLFCCITLHLESQRVAFWRVDLLPSAATHTSKGGVPSCVRRQGRETSAQW
jgi:hypothetical protein